MAILKSLISPRDAKFKTNAEAMGKLTTELALRRAEHSEGRLNARTNTTRQGFTALYF